VQSPRAVRVGRALSVPTVGLLIAVLSGRHPGHDRFEGIGLEALAGEILLIKDPGHFAIDSDLFHVVAAAVVGDREDFEGEAFNLTLARESVRSAKLLMPAEPAAYRSFGRHRGIGTNGPEAFTVDEPVADRFSDLGTVTGRKCEAGQVERVRIARSPRPRQRLDSSRRTRHMQTKNPPKRGRSGPTVFSPRWNVNRAL
jgi:hypothetical protein